MFIARPNRRFTLARIDDAQYHLERGDAPPSLLDEARAIATGDMMLGEPIWLRHRRGRDHPDEARRRADHQALRRSASAGR